MQDYKLKDFKPSDLKDQHLNVWCDAIFEGLGEPVKWVVKDPSKIVVGQSYYGEMREMTSQAGKAYVRFYRKERPDGEPVPANDSSNFESVDKQDSIIRQSALKAAVNYSSESNQLTTDGVLKTADTFYAWLKNETTTAVVDKVFPKDEEDRDDPGIPMGGEED